MYTSNKILNEINNINILISTFKVNKLNNIVKFLEQRKKNLEFKLSSNKKIFEAI
jgi:hypothetical protein